MSIGFRDESVLKDIARQVVLEKGEMLFSQGEAATNFFIIRQGKIKMSHYSEQGREFVQGYFTKGQSFGEPPFFAKMTYPASALATERSIVWKISYDRFINLLREQPELSLELIETLSERLIYKSMMLSEVAIEEAEHRIKSLLYFLKAERGIAPGKEFAVPYTRQQLADMTGLRVETVIRTVKAMQHKGLLDIIEGKIFWLPKNNRKDILNEHSTGHHEKIAA